MTIWFWPETLTDEARTQTLSAGVLVSDAAGVPNLSRLQGRDQLVSGLSQKFPDFSPEEINAHSEELWRLGHEIAIDDHIVVLAEEGRVLMLGEITGPYFYDIKPSFSVHAIPVSWLITDLPTEKVPAIAAYKAAEMLVEVQDEALQQLQRHIPSFRRVGHMVFKWISVILLISELIYFWPR